MLIDGGRTTTHAPVVPLPQTVAAPPPPVTPAYRSAPDASHHPQFPIAAAGGPTPALPPQTGPYALPAGSTLVDTVSGAQAQPFDVTLSQLATAVYGERGDPPTGWQAVSDDDIAQQLGVAGQPDAADRVQTWRETFLGGGEQTTEQEFRAEVYRDADGNFVLSYRGTAEGMADWQNNFEQGTGFQTDPVDKFSGTAVNTAVEFARVFGNDGSSNLAITGHSQGGGLASVGSLASGIPAVTFDASGIHPETLDRMGLADPQAARDIAEGGQIRAYSLSSDALTNLQETTPFGLLAPDALGTSIVVAPAAADEHHMFEHYGPIELAGKTPQQLAQINAAVEAARNAPWYAAPPPINLLLGGANLTGDLAYAAISHSPNALTAGMIDREPWQPGYENPSSLARDLQDLVPDALKDDYAGNTHETIEDIATVVETDFRNGDYVQGAWSIYGDLTAGVANSVGDTLNRGSEALADVVDQSVNGPVGDILAGTIGFGGDAANVTADVIGGTGELLADGAGAVGQTTSDFLGWLASR